MSAQPEDLDQQPQMMDEVSVQEALRSYNRQQILLHMIGPVISLVLHIVALTLMSQMVLGSSRDRQPDLQVETVTLEPKELDPTLQNEIKELEEIEVETEMVTDVPEMDAPALPTNEQVDTVAAESIGEAMPEETTGAMGDFAFTESNIAMSESPLQISGVYALRQSGSSRKAAITRFGGSQATEDAVEKCLQWLQRIRKPNGSWENSVPHTSLALLCFLAHGETPLSPKYGTTVREGLRWLSAAMLKTPPNKPCGGRAYSHGIATYALAEAYGLTKIPFLRAAMERGLETIIRGQQPAGGFDYNYAQGARWDLSVAGWQVQALKAGIAAEANLPGLTEAATKSVEWIKKTTYKNGKFGYSSPGSGGNMTGVGTVCLQLLGEMDSSEVKGGCETIANERLTAYKQFVDDKDYSKDGAHLLYGWYYDTQAMFNQGGRAWREWNKVFNRVLIKAQHDEGYWEFTGEKNHIYGAAGNQPGRILASTWTCLQLEVYYRYLPTFDIHRMMEKKETKSAAESVLGDDMGIQFE